MASTLAYIAFGFILIFSMIRHLRRMHRNEAQARAAADRSSLRSDGPQAQHPHIDATHCIGCGACVDVCPEGDVLAVIGGTAAIVNGHKCIGHGLCADACPVGAITIVMASPSVGADMPQLTPSHETSVPNVFIAGELGGLALIKNAVNDGRECIDTIATRLPQIRRGQAQAGVYDVCIVGAGPAGISASLRAVERKLSYVTIEQDEFGGTVAKYPRQKLVLTSPVEFPLHGKFNKLQLSKEDILRFWEKLQKQASLKVNTNEKVENIRREDGAFTVETTKGRYRALSVVLALGRRGTPRKLGVNGEQLAKVMYGLIEAEAYTNNQILVVGGGDSAVEAALGLAHQKGNRVTLSYRREAFSRIKERNAQRIAECMKSGRVQVVFNSQPVDIRDRAVQLEVAGAVREIPNDYVWVFAGGTPPREFLEKVGIAIGPRDLTGAAGAHVTPASRARRLAS